MGVAFPSSKVHKKKKKSEPTVLYNKAVTHIVRLLYLYFRRLFGNNNISEMNHKNKIELNLHLTYWNRDYSDRKALNRDPQETGSEIGLVYFKLWRGGSEEGASWEASEKVSGGVSGLHVVGSGDLSGAGSRRDRGMYLTSPYVRSRAFK